MPGGRDDDEDKTGNGASFMSRHFPDAIRLRQNKQENRPAKTNLNKRARASTSDKTIDRLPPGLPAELTISADDDLCYQGNGVQNRLMRQLKRGQLHIDNRLDLHGQTIAQAHQSTMQFLSQCQQPRQSCVLIIHGQGYRSAGGVPVLKLNVRHWLQEHAAVVAFHSAIPRDGGKGAVYVLLQKTAESL
jgi:DNA-nicking Smr family endonuclease